MSCAFDTSHYSFLHWVHPSEGQITLQDSRVALLGRIIRILIFNTSPSDGGEYRCVFSRTGGGANVYATAEAVYKPPVVFITHFNEPISNFIGANLTVTCLAENFQAIQWQMDDYSVIPIGSVEDRVYSKAIEGGIELYIHNLTLTDSGHYHCTAKNEVTDVLRATANIVVYGGYKRVIVGGGGGSYIVCN